MRKRSLLVLIGLLAVVATLVLLKGAQISVAMAAGKRMQRAGPPPETVSTGKAVQQTWDETLQSVGSVTAARGVSISNDAPGIVSAIRFESGAGVKQGQILVELDTKVERAQLASSRARRELAAQNDRRSHKLIQSGSIARSELDNDDAQLAGAVADVNALQAQIERKIVRAPFAGKLGIRLVNVGQYLPPGTPITVLESTEATYVDFSLPQQDLSLVAQHMPVRFTLDHGERMADGAVFAIDPAIDPVTRSIKVRATVTDERLRPGMFVNVSVVLPKQDTVIAVSVTAIVHASYGDSVFIVEGDTARQQFVRLGAVRGDFIAVTEGVSAGQEVVTAGAFKLKNRARIAVNNEIELHPELQPHPENR